MGREWNTIVSYYKEGKVIFSKKIYLNGLVSCRLEGLHGRKKHVLDKMILELTESVLAPYGVFSFIKRLGISHDKPRKKYESEQGLAADIYDWIKRYETEPVWRTEKEVALWSRGYHRELMQFLDKHCRSRFSCDPYWNGEVSLYGFQNLPENTLGEDVWNRLSEGAIEPDLVVTYRSNYHIWVDFRFRCINREEIERVCKLIEDTCERHGIVPERKDNAPDFFNV